MDCHGSAALFSRKTHQEVKQWSVKLQGKKRDCLPRSFVSELPNAVYLKIPEIKKIEKLKTIWDNWTVERQNAFTVKYGDIALLLLIEIDEQLLKAIILFSDLSYWCFTFNHEDLTPIVEEYTALLRISPPNPDKIFLEKVKKSLIQKEISADDKHRCKCLHSRNQVEREE